MTQQQTIHTLYQFCLSYESGTPFFNLPKGAKKIFYEALDTYETDKYTSEVKPQEADTQEQQEQETKKENG